MCIYIYGIILYGVIHHIYIYTFYICIFPANVPDFFPGIFGLKVVAISRCSQDVEALAHHGTIPLPHSVAIVT